MLNFNTYTGACFGSIENKVEKNLTVIFVNSNGSVVDFKSLNHDKKIIEKINIFWSILAKNGHYKVFYSCENLLLIDNNS